MIDKLLITAFETENKRLEEKIKQSEGLRQIEYNSGPKKIHQAGPFLLLSPLRSQ